MKNGDRMTCEIKTMDAGAVYVGLDYVNGTIAVEWSRIARLTSPRLFLVELDDGSVYTGHINAHPVEGSESVLLEITPIDGTTVAFDISRIAGLSRTSDSFWGRLNGNVTSGVSFTKGNNTSTYNLSSNVNYPRPRWTAAATFNSNLSSSSGLSASTRNQVSLVAGHLMRWNNWYYTGFASGLQSAEQQISLQSNLGGGVGRYFKKTSNLRISGVGGLVWQQTVYESSVASANTQEMLGVMLMGTVNFRAVQENLAAVDGQRDSVPERTRTILLQHQRQLLPEIVRRHQLESLLLRQLGYPAPRGDVGQRLRLELRAQLDVRKPIAT